MKCPECGGSNFGWAKKCDHCGHELLSDSIPAQPGTVANNEVSVSAPTTQTALPDTAHYTSKITFKFVVAGAVLGAVIWVWSGNWRFGTVVMGLTPSTAAVWASIVLIVSGLCFGTGVGLIVWPFAVGFISNLFGAQPAAWRNATMTSLFIGVLVAIVVGAVVGGGLGFAVGLLLPPRFRARRAIDLALQHDNVGAVTELMAKAKLPHVDARRRRKETLLMLAAQYGAIESARMLLDSGADVNATDDTGSTALLHSMASRRKLAMVKLLVERGADVEHTNRYGRRAGSGLSAAHEVNLFLTEAVERRKLSE